MLTLKKINLIFQEKNPNGYIYTNKQGVYTVVYNPNNKSYNYTANNLGDLATKLNMVPDVDMIAESKSVIARLESGQETVTGLTRLSTTINQLFSRDGYMIQEQDAGMDDYNRNISEYTIVEYSIW